MKLISLNVEGKKHESTALPFIEAEQADVVCLQEVPEDWCEKLELLGYKTTFAPMVIRNKSETYTEGILFASRHLHEVSVEYYHRSQAEVTGYDKENRELMAHAVISGTVNIHQEEFLLATTHIMVTPDGLANDHQVHGITKLLQILSTIR